MDCIISIGVKLTDTITGGFTQGFTKEQVIEIHPYTVKIIDKKYGPDCNAGYFTTFK